MKNIDPILWYDWPFIFRHRRHLESLDNVLLLTRGAPLSLTSLLTAIRPMDHVFTGVYQPEGKNSKLIGQVHQSPNMNGAHINYLLQVDRSDPGAMVVLLEGLVKEVGNWGAKQITADLNTDSELFPQFRRAGFSVLAKQRVFRCAIPGKNIEVQGGRRIWSSEDIPIMRRLYLTLVPPLIQPVEPLTRREMLGLVFYDNQGCLQAYADLVYGPVGIWVLPLIHPQTQISIDAMLAKMILQMPDINGRKVYITARSYQPWVESGLEAMGGEPGPEQGLMIHYMALRRRLEADFPFALVENGNAEPTVPYSTIKNHRD